MLLYVTTISLNTLFITTPQGLIMLPRGKVFSWMLFPCNFHQQTAFKDDRATLTELLRVKKQYKFHGNNSMQEHNNALQNTNTCPRLQSRMQNICFVLNFCCYFETNGQNHIHFQLIQVLKNSMAWYFLTITAPSSSSKLESVYPPCCRVKGSLNPTPKLTISYSSKRLYSCVS